MNILLYFTILIALTLQTFGSTSEYGYIVGVDSSDAALWLTDVAGNVAPAIKLKNPVGTNSDGIAESVISVFNNLYIVGGYNIPSPGSSSLWIGNLAGNMQNAMNLKNINGSNNQNGLSYSITTLSNTIYMSGIDYHNGSYHPCLWISDLAGNAKNSIDLKNPDGSNPPNGYAIAVTTYLNTLYIAGADYHNGNYYPCLWISDLAGNAQNAIELKNPDGSSSSNGNAYGITAYVDKLYIVGEDYHGGSTYPCLWISDLAGNAQNAIELKNPDGSTAPGGAASAISTYSDRLYIVGQDYRNGSSYPCLWISDLAGNAQNAIELKNPDGSSAVSGKAYSIYFPIPLATQLTQAANSFGNLIYLKKSL